MSNVEQILKKKKIEYRIHKYSHDHWNIHFAKEASDKLWVPLERIFKTLVVDWNGELLVAVISSSKELDLKLFAKKIGLKKMKMWEKKDVEQITGYVFWGISPLWQRKQLQTFIDDDAKNFETIFVSAGNKWVELEISPYDLVKLVSGSFLHISNIKK